MDGNKFKGRVKWFNSEQGFGFILLEDGRDAYLPYTALSLELQNLIGSDLWEGLPIECRVDDTEQGLRAVQITRQALEADLDPQPFDVGRGLV